MTHQPGQNISIAFSTSLLKSQVKMCYGLTYFKLRKYVELAGTYGSFTPDEQLAAFLQLAPRTVKKHIDYCLGKGWVRLMPGNGNRYQLVSMYKLGGRTEAAHMVTAFLTDEQLFAITSHNVADLKAIFNEYEIERYVRHQKHVKRKQQGGEWSHRDHCFINKQPKRKSRNDTSKGESVTYIACRLASTLTGVSSATAHRYRSRTVSYFGNKVGLPVEYVNSKRKVLALDRDVNDLVIDWNNNKSLAIDYFAKGDVNSPLGQEILYGYFLICRDGIYLRAASKRIGRVEVRRLRIGRRFPVLNKVLVEELI